MQVFNSEVATCHCLFRSLAVCFESRRVNQTAMLVGFPIWNCLKMDTIYFALLRVTECICED
jgi:hypothetical protein